MKNFHLTKAEFGWQLKEEGDKYAYKIFKTDKETAIKESSEELKALNKPCSLKIHKGDGTFQEERTFPHSADPVSSRG